MHTFIYIYIYFPRGRKRQIVAIVEEAKWIVFLSSYMCASLECILLFPYPQIKLTLASNVFAVKDGILLLLRNVTGFSQNMLQ